MRAQDLALQRDKYSHLSDEEWRWWLQQVDGRERTAAKLPTFAGIDDWWYPVRLSCEQCSSELTARYKASLFQSSTHSVLDLTGGYGVDTFFLSERFIHTDYVEQNEELCRIAKHNFANRAIAIHNTSAETFLQTAEVYDLIFLDPARRDNYGGKVFRLEDCTPNVVELLPTLLAHGKRILLKLSPMLDLSQAVKELSFVQGTSSLGTLSWDIHVVAIKNEVKEVLLLSGGTGQITAIDLVKKAPVFTFIREEEINSKATYVDNTINSEAINYLYEPNGAILKAGAYKLVATRFGLHKLDINTHLYCSETVVSDFPGRVWQVIRSIKDRKDLPTDLQQANILVRNYPLTPEQLKHKYKLKDGGEDFLIGARVNGSPTLFWAQRIEKTQKI